MQVSGKKSSSDSPWGTLAPWACYEIKLHLTMRLPLCVLLQVILKTDSIVHNIILFFNIARVPS